MAQWQQTIEYTVKTIRIQITKLTCRSTTVRAQATKVGDTVQSQNAYQRNWKNWRSWQTLSADKHNQIPVSLLVNGCVQAVDRIT